MAVYWVNAGTSNRFGNKHLYIVDGERNLASMVDEGFRIFDERVRSNYLANKQHKNRSEWRETNSLKSQYGAAAVSQNTMIMLTSAGLKGLEQKITGKGRNPSGWYDIHNGVIFDTDNQSYVATLVASVKLDIRTCRGGVEVYHLAGVDLRAVLKREPGTSNREVTIMPTPNDPKVLGMHFTPNVADLVSAKAHLRSPG